MEKNILNNIHSLYRSYVITLILFLILGCVTILVSVGVVKFGLIKSKLCQILQLIVISISVVVLLIIQVHSIVPIYQDYKDASYIVLENATMTILTDASGLIDRTNVVLVEDGLGNPVKLKMPNDIQLSVGYVYTGTVVYTKRSGFVVWHSFD